MIDSQSVKADAVVGSDSRGFDGGKLINGRKRHVVVDTLGLLLGVMVTAADTGSLVEHCPAALALVLAIVERGDDTRGFVVLPMRWIVKRFFAHLMRSRRLARDFERRTASTEAVIYWSMTMVMTRRMTRSRPTRA
ncbi:transposase [Streptomyces sp. NPDC101118]|uniref:transposase n=1 Tax=Streptomyces sp. NPDC101118 TaxID=3366109 RepID=UPI0038018280